jgi:hypothetical protein
MTTCRPVRARRSRRASRARSRPQCHTAPSPED